MDLIIAATLILLVYLSDCSVVCAFSSSSFITASSTPQQTTIRRRISILLNSYYGGESESGSSPIKEFSLFEQLQQIVELSSQPMPERPDGIVTVVKYTSSTREDCKSTEAQYERLARNNPATIFLRSFKEYENSHLLFGKANVHIKIL